MKILPKGWEIKTLAGVLGDKNKSFLDGDWILSKNMVEDGEYGIVQLKHIGVREFLHRDFLFISKDTFKELKCTVLRTGDLLVSRMAEPICRSCILPELPFPTVTAVYVTIIRPDLKIADVSYLNFLMNTDYILNQAKKYTAGATRPRISRKNLEKIPIPHPPLKTQKKIVAILEKTEAIKNHHAEQSRLLDDYLKSVFLEMFGDPGTNPKGWEITRLDDVADIERNSISPEEIDVVDIYIGLEHIESNSGTILEKKNAVETELKSSKFRFDQECLLYGKLRPYLNKVALPNCVGVCSTDILPIRPISQKSNRYFLTHLLRHSHYVALANSQSVGANLPRIGPKALGAFSIYAPPITLQNKFAAIVQQTEKIKARHEESAKHADDLFNALMQKAFTGELVA
jgi:type I restriction enzyme S subunit